MNIRTFIKFAAAVAIVGLICAIAYGVYFYLSTQGKVAVIIYTVPNNASITLLNKDTGITSIASVGTNYLVPGSYSVQVSANGFGSKNGSFSTSDTPLTPQLFSLTPETSAAKQWLKEHQDQATQLYSYSEQRVTQLSSAQINTFPIQKALPFVNPYYTIGYTAPPSPKVSITTNSPQYRYAAIQKIRQLGYNPDDYQFVFYGFTNPLTRKVGN